MVPYGLYNPTQLIKAKAVWFQCYAACNKLDGFVYRDSLWSVERGAGSADVAVRGQTSVGELSGKRGSGLLRRQQLQAHRRSGNRLIGWIRNSLK